MGVAYNSRIITDGLVLALDAANPKSYPTKNFVSSKIYSSFGGSIRSSNYTVQYSDDNSNWTTAFTGVASNNTSCGIQQNTGSGSGSYGLHRYWRYVEGSPIQSHHPRVSRIILTDINGIDYNLVVYTSDNCSDTGTYQVGTVSLDFGGTTWTDMSTNGNTGTLVNGVGYSASNGGALVFDGSDDYVYGTVPYTGNTNVTITGFAEITLGTAGCIIKVGDGCAGYSMGIGGNYFSDNGNNIVGLYSCIRWLSTGVSWNSGWNGFAMVIDGSGNASFYKNGFLVASSNGSAPAAVSGSYYLGRCVGDESSGSERAFEGKLASVKIYNRALTAAEISQNFNALRGRYGI